MPTTFLCIDTRGPGSLDFRRSLAAILNPKANKNCAAGGWFDPSEKAVHQGCLQRHAIFELRRQTKRRLFVGHNSNTSGCSPVVEVELAMYVDAIDAVVYEVRDFIRQRRQRVLGT